MAALRSPGSISIQPWVIAVLVTAAAAAGFIGGLLTDTAATEQRLRAVPPRLKLVVPEYLFSREAGSAYRVLGSTVWPKTVWGRNCSGAVPLSNGEKALCELPSIWKKCTQGIYLDIGTNVGGQLRKLYDAWQFPKASVLGLFNETYGVNRSGVCAIGVEANPVHTPYLNVLNDYFKRKGYQAIVLTDTAASISTGKATLHQDHGSPVEWGASLAAGDWQKQSSSTANEAVVATLDLPSFVAEIVRPLVVQVQRQTGVRPPVGMKMDVEGAEYALLPGLITSGGLCDLSMIYLEPHRKEMRDQVGVEVNMTVYAMEWTFERMRKANPKCKVQYSHLDDESYLHAHTEVPLPP